jgi:hypothetical protein
MISHIYIYIYRERERERERIFPVTAPRAVTPPLKGMVRSPSQYITVNQSEALGNLTRMPTSLHANVSNNIVKRGTTRALKCLSII